MNHVVAGPRPLQARRRVARMMRHARSARRKNREVGSAFLLYLKLELLDALANLVISYFQGRRRGFRMIFQMRQLVLAKQIQLARRGGVVSMAIDDHLVLAMLGCDGAGEITWLNCRVSMVSFARSNKVFPPSAPL